MFFRRFFISCLILMNFFLVGLEIHEKADGGIRFAIQCAENSEIDPEKKIFVPTKSGIEICCSP